jgi:predicted nucleotidyltransferase
LTSDPDHSRALPDEFLDVIDGDPSGLPELLREHCVSLLVLFGSTAKAKRHPRSDLDLAVLFQRPADCPPLTCADAGSDERVGLDIWRRAAELELSLDKVLLPKCPVNLVPLEVASPLLRQEVAEHGLLLHEAEPGRWLERRIRYFRGWELEEKFHRRAWEALVREFAGQR